MERVKPRYSPSIADRLMQHAVYSTEAAALIETLLPGGPATYSRAAQKEALNKVEAMLKVKRGTAQG